VTTLKSEEPRIAAGRGGMWAPGHRAGLHRLLRTQALVISPFSIEVCVRYGPMESLYEDLHAKLRRYELLLWGALVAVLQHVYPAQHGDSAAYGLVG
jgi:hypothetical protein